tara:strand:- start:44 stop:268 length:225 start_codon:yes stop_codon:yes gene_type:complete
MNTFKNKLLKRLFPNMKYRIRPNRMFTKGNCETWYGIKGKGKDTLLSIYFGSLALYVFKPSTFWSLERTNLDNA